MLLSISKVQWQTALDVHSLHVVTDSGQRELWSVVTTLRFAVLVGHGAGTPVRATQTVQTDYEEPRHVECLARATQERAPPIGDIGAATQSVTDDQGIVTLGRESASSGIRNGHIMKCDTGLEGERWNDRNVLILDQAGVGVLRLRIDSLYGI